MSASQRVQAWRQRMREEGKEPMTIWLDREEKLRLEDVARLWRCSPSALVQQALANFHPMNPYDTVTRTDTEQLRALIQGEIAVSPHVTATVTATVAATLAQDLPALVRQLVEEMALEALGLPVTDTNSDVTDTEPHRETIPRQPSQRQRGGMRQSILDLLGEHPEGLSAEEIRVYLRPEKPLGDTLQGMRRQGRVRAHGKGKDIRYFVE